MPYHKMVLVNRVILLGEETSSSLRQGTGEQFGLPHPGLRAVIIKGKIFKQQETCYFKKSKSDRSL